jgi:16S rRNA (adenine1518-N6/adenine1519-N6)-dimethyltransferase
MNTTQIFLANYAILKKIVDFAQINDNDVVLEIGSGDGRLTELLAKRAKRVYGLEIDPELADISKYKLSAFNNVEIINADALAIEWPEVNKIVSNLPYAIA